LGGGVEDGAGDGDSSGGSQNMDKKEEDLGVNSEKEVMDIFYEK